MTTFHPQVDAYIARTKRWPELTNQLRTILVKSGLEEAFKWGKPCYQHEGTNVAIIQGFKDHCSVMFFRGSLMKDPKGVMVRPGANSQAGMRIEFTSEAHIRKLTPVLRAYVKEAVGLVDAGIKVDFKEKRELELPEELSAAFKKRPALGKAFRSLTPGRQRAWVLHFSGAKQSATRTSRIEKASPRILEGKGMNDRD